MPSLVVGTAGHIDHGKSTLVEALSGVHPDRLEEEQRRGISIELGFAHASIRGIDVAFVDVPGHERFVRHMLAGAGGVDAVLLVVDAGESVKPQTREHFDICRLLGVDRGAIAVTKIDAVDPDAVARTEADVRALVAGSFLAAAPVVPVSARRGTGLDALREALAGLAHGALRQARPGVARLPIDRVFAAKGFGAVVTGTLVSGEVAVGDSLMVLPRGAPVRVRGLQMHGAPVERARATGRVAVNLAGIEVTDLQRGLTLATPGSIAVTRRADVRLHLLTSAPPLRHGARVRVHAGTAELFARVSIAAWRQSAGEPWMAPGTGATGAAVPPGGDAFARLRFEAPVCLTRGDRLIVRHWSPAATIGGAVVLDPEPPAASPRRPAARARFDRLDPGSDAASWLIEEAGLQGVDGELLVRRGGLSPDEASQVLAEHVGAGNARAIGRRCVETRALAALGERLHAAVAAFHRAQPDSDGIPRDTLRGQSAAGVSPEVFDVVVSGLVERGVLKGVDRLALAGYQRVPATGEERLRAVVEDAIRAGGLTPPDPSGLTAIARAAQPVVDRIVAELVRTGRFVRAGGLLFHADALAALKASTAALGADRAPGARVVLDVAAFKARHALTRKHAIPLLEWLDRERVTRRVGDTRVVL